jgi:hypothetical protein
MILVAATAVGLWLTTWSQGAFAMAGMRWSNVYDECLEALSGSPTRGIVARALELVLAAVMAVYLIAPVTGLLTLSLLPLRLMSPRPRRRRLARQPGFTATCAASIAFVFVGVGLARVVADMSYPRSTGLAEIVELWGTLLAGVAVLVSWVCLLISGRWRAEPSWIDRLGRAMGVFWIAQAIAMTLLIAFGEV